MSKRGQRGGMLAFFPWLRLQEYPTVGPYELVPHSRGEQPAGTGEGTSEQATLDGILEPYVSSRAERIGRATLLRCDGGELTAELTEEQRQRMFEFSEVVAFAGLAALVRFRRRPHRPGTSTPDRVERDEHSINRRAS